MIIFDKVSKKFFNDTFGVKNVSFYVDEGEFVLITGPTGSGKTTLMKLITKEYSPEEGEIIFKGQPLAEIEKSMLPEHRRQVGVVFQDYRLLPESNVWENVALPLMIAGKTETEIEERVTDLLQLVKLEDKADLFLNELSGGEAQRVSIARALATAPILIFADEPTGNLDKETSLKIIKLLKKINELGTTVLLSTHDMVVLNELADIRRLELKNGELTLDTKPKKKKKTTAIKATQEDLEPNGSNKNNKAKPKKTSSKDKKEEKPKKSPSIQETVESLDDQPKKSRFKLPLKKLKLKITKQTSKPEKA